MYRTRKRVRDEGVASSVQQSRAESSRVRDDGVASLMRKSRAESSRVRDDVVASSMWKSRAESSRVRDDVGASSIRKSRGETSRGPSPDHSSFRDDSPMQDIHDNAVNSKVSAILESIRSVLPEGEASQRSAYDKLPAHLSLASGIFWKDKSDLDAFRACADGANTSKHQEIDGGLSTTEALHKRLERLEQLLVSSQTASMMKQQEDHQNDSLVRLLGFSSKSGNVRLRQGSIEETHRSANISRVLEEVDSQVQPTRSHRNLDTETFVRRQDSFPANSSREMLTRGNVTVSNQLAENQGVRGRKDSQVQSKFPAPSRINLEPQISSHPPNSLSVIDALEVLLSGNITGNVKHGNVCEDSSHIDSRFQANHRTESLRNSDQIISSPPPCPLPLEHFPEELIAGNIMGSGKQAKILEFQTRRESQVKAKLKSQLNGNSDSQMSSFQPNYMPVEDFPEDGVTGNIVKDKRPKIHKTKQKVNSQLHGSHHAQIYENSEPRVSAVPLNSLPMEDSPEMLGTEGKRMETQRHGKTLGFQCETDIPIQTIDMTQSHGDSDSHGSSSAQSPKSREESPEVLISEFVMENSKHGKIRKARCQPVSQVQDTIPLNSLPMEDFPEVRKIGRRGRGCTRLDDVWNMPEGERIICEFNEQCQPIKAEGRLLTRFIGTVVRKPNLAPLDVKGWLQMPKEKKEEMCNIVESRFLIPAERREEIKAWIITDLADKWRNYKCVLKSKYFDENKPLSELIRLRPPSVDKDQWIGLLNIWNSPKWKRISEVNKKNRENHKINHTSGTMSYAMIEAEMKERNGVAPTQAQVFAKTHRHKDGTDVNEDTAKAIEEFEKIGTQDKDADKVGNTSEDDVCGQYCGPEKLSRLRGKRKGLSLWNGGKSKRLQTIRVRREEYWSSLQQQKVMKEQLRAQEDRLKSLENKMSALLSTLQENLSQQDLVNILKKATQAEAPSGSGGSDPEY